MWFSIMYLPLAEATVISFLAPCLAGYLCHLILKTPFTRKEQIATFVAMFGVLLIARPVSLFHGWGGDHGTEQQGAEPSVSPTDMAANSTLTVPQMGEEPTDAQRLGAIGFALIGVLGAAGAFTTIRWIGKRAHALISVNYFSIWCTVVSTAILVLAPVLDVGQPSLHFALPSTPRQWALLISLGVCGFLLQFMLTYGLAVEKSNRATCMVYTQMLFAAGFDKWIFGYEMGPISLTGCGFIISSLLWVALSDKEDPEKAVGADVELGAIRDLEEVPMLGPDESDIDGFGGEAWEASAPLPR
jgi:drug/metabolite transporter (DMT)-like permease